MISVVSFRLLVSPTASPGFLGPCAESKRPHLSDARASYSWVGRRGRCGRTWWVSRTDGKHPKANIFAPENRPFAPKGSRIIDSNHAGPQVRSLQVSGKVYLGSTPPPRFTANHGLSWNSLLSYYQLVTVTGWAGNSNLYQWTQKFLVLIFMEN